MNGKPDLTKYRYTKSSGGVKRKQTSTSSTSDPGTSPELNERRKQERKLCKEGEKKKQKQSCDLLTEDMGHPLTLEELQVQLEKLATKDDILMITEKLNKVNETLLKRVDILEGKLFDLEGEKNELGNEVKRLKTENVSLCDQLEQGRKEVASLRAAQNDQEQHGRSWNVRVYGVREERGGEETAEQCMQKCIKIFNEQVGVSVRESDVEVAHRSGRPGGTRPRPILLRFLTRRKKGQVLAERRKLKNSGVSVSEDLTRTNYQLLTKASKHSATLAAWSSNGKIIAKIKNGKTLQIPVACDVDKVMSKAMT